MCLVELVNISHLTNSRNVEKLQLKVNMFVKILQDPCAVTFSKQLLDISNGQVALYKSTGCITLPTDFSTIVDSQIVLIECIFPYTQIMSDCQKESFWQQKMRTSTVKILRYKNYYQINWCHRNQSIQFVMLKKL